MRLLVFAFCVLALVAGGCSHASSDAEGGKKTIAEQDAELATKLQKAPEARQWLAGANHAMFEISNADAQELVEAAYSAGATKVYVSDAEDNHGQGEVGSTLVIEIPADQTTRKKIFAAEAAWWKKRGEDEGTPDQGQKYLEVFTD